MGTAPWLEAAGTASKSVEVCLLRTAGLSCITAAALLQEVATLRATLAAAEQKKDGMQAQLGRLQEDLARAGAESEALHIR